MANHIKHLSELPINDYRASYDNAVKLYNTHPYAIKDDKFSNDANIIGQTNQRPMHPYLFYELSQVRGFNNLNGYRYDEYFKNFVNSKIA